MPSLSMGQMKFEKLSIIWHYIDSWKLLAFFNIFDALIVTNSLIFLSWIDSLENSLHGTVFNYDFIIINIIFIPFQILLQ